MNRELKYILIGIIIALAIAVVSLLVILGLNSSRLSSSTGITPVVIRETAIVETVIVEVTPTVTPTPEPTPTTFPTSLDRIVFLSVWEDDFYIINADGTDLARVTFDGSQKSCPVWHPDGQRISYYAASREEGYLDYFIMDANGDNKELLFTAKLDTEYGQSPVWSPDGSKIAYTAFDAGEDSTSHIYIFDGQNSYRLDDRTEMQRFPVWSPDSSKIAYTSHRSNKLLYIASTLDGIQHWLITELPASFYNPVTWSPDGKYIALVADKNLYIVEFGNIENIDQRTAQNLDTFKRPQWSPDGEWIAFYYQFPGPSSADVFTMDAERPFSVNHLTSQIWAYTGAPLSWSPDGKEIAFVGEHTDENWNLYIAHVLRDTPKQLTDSDRRDHCPAWSP